MTDPSSPSRHNIAAKVLRVFGVFQKHKAANKLAPARKSPPLPKPRKSPAAAPAAKLTASPSPLLAIPEHVNLLGAGTHSISLDDTSHTIAFKNDGLYLDGLKYIFLAQSTFGDANMSLLEVLREGDTLRIQADAWGKKESIVLKEDKASSIMRLLLQRHPFSTETDNGLTIRVERQMY